MKHHHLLLIIMVVCLLAAPAAASISDSSVINTNVYAGSSVYSIAPDGYYDSASSATGISNVAGRYIYASALGNSVSESTATLILTDRQGATVNLTDSTVVSGIAVDWGDGSTSDSLTHQYTENGIYNVTATITNYLDQTGITLTDRVQIGDTSISISVSPAVLTTGQSWTLTADAVIADTVQWQVSRNNATWTAIPEGTYTPAEYGEYYFRTIAYGADVTVVSNVVQTEYRYAVTDSTVTNTNVYAGSNVYSIAPDGYYDSASSATGISNVAGRYIYASALGNSVNESTATLILMDRQGATVNLTDSTVVSGILVNWGDGSTSDSLTHEYTADGIYNVTATVSNYLDNIGITLTDRVQIGATSISISVSPTVLTTGQSWTLTADAVIADTVQWQVSRNNATWTDIPEGTYTPAEYGEYYFRAIAYGADVTVISNVVQTEYRYAVTDSTVVNTNVYAGSSVYSIAPDGYYDSASSATGITNVANRYIYATALGVTESGKTALYSISGMQGSTSTLADGKVVQGYLWDYGDGKTAQTTQLSHSYDAPGRYVTTLQLYNYLDSTGITLTGNPMYVGPFVGDISADKTAGGLGDTFNISVVVRNVTSLEWQLSRQAVGGWSTISGADGTNYTLIPDSPGNWKIRVKASNSITGFTEYTDVITITVYAKPATGNIKVSPGFGPLNAQVQLSAGVEDPGSALQATTYQWQISTGGNWTDIAGATQKISTVTLSLDSPGTHYFRLAATGIGGTAYSAAAEYRAYAAPTFTSVKATPEKGGAPLQVLLSAQASDATAYRWEYSTGGGVWMQVAKSAAAYYTIQADGEYYFRAVATGFGGTTYSNPVTVLVGELPDAQIITPQYSGMWFETGSSISFSGASAGSGVSYSWDFGDGSTASGLSVTHTYTRPGEYEVIFSATNRFGTDQARISVIISDPTGDVQLTVSDVSPTGADLFAVVTTSPIQAGTMMWFEISSESGQVVLRSPQKAYTGAAISFDASGLPLISGKVYSAVAYTNNYGSSLPQVFKLLDAVSTPYEPMGDAWTDGLSRDPFNISALVSAGIGVYGSAMGGGATGSTVAFGVIALFVIVGLWLRQQDVVIPLTLTLVAGWFVIGNLPGEWQPIAYTLMIVAIVAIFFYLFRKRVE